MMALPMIMKIMIVKVYLNKKVFSFIQAIYSKCPKKVVVASVVEVKQEDNKRKRIY